MAVDGAVVVVAEAADAIGRTADPEADAGIVGAGAGVGAGVVAEVVAGIVVGARIAAETETVVGGATPLVVVTAIAQEDTIGIGIGNAPGKILGIGRDTGTKKRVGIRIGIGKVCEAKVKTETRTRSNRKDDLVETTEPDLRQGKEKKMYRKVVERSQSGLELDSERTKRGMRRGGRLLSAKTAETEGSMATRGSP